MTEHELTKITLTLDTDVKGSDVNVIDALADALEKLDKVPVNTKISGNLKKIAEAFSVFNNLNLKSGIGANIGGIVETISKIENIKDISPYAENLNKGFAALSQAVKNFEGNTGKIPINLGRGISGIVEATNKITEVKDISRFAETLKSNFKTIADSAREMVGIPVVNYSGISKMIEALSSAGEIKPIGNNVVTNAGKLAQAINVLDTNVNASTPRLNALANASNAVNRGFKEASKGSARFGASLKLINTAVIIRAVNTIVRSLTSLTRKLYGLVDAYGDVQNTMSFFAESLGDQASSTAAIIQQYVDLGAVRFDEFGNQVAKLSQIYRGYGIASEDAAKMALNLTQLAYDASYALGENGKDIALWMQRATSVATGQTRAGYYFGVDTSIAALRNEFDNLSSSTDKATKSYAAYETIIKHTTALQGQLAKEYTNTYVQMQVYQNRLQQLRQSLGMALVPMFQTIIRWGLTALKVVEYVIDALVKLFGGEGFELINYSNMIDNIANSTSGVAGATEDVASGITGANKAAKELKKTISGIDQVFTINDIAGSNAGGSGTGGVGGLPSAGVSGYDWLETLASAENLGMLSKIEADAKGIVENLKEMVPLALTIGGLFAGWKLLSLITDLGTALTKMNELSGVLGGLGSIVIGVTLALVGYEIFKDGLWGLFDGDITWENIGKTVGGAIMAGIGLGMVAYGAITLFTSAFPESALATWASTSGITLGGLIKVGIGVGMALGGVALMLSGFKDAFENGFDWKNMGMIAGGVILTGIGLALAASAVKSVIGKATGGGELAGNVVESLTGAKTQVEAIDTATGGVSTKLVSLAKNIAIGVGILALVAAAAVIFVGAIWVIGELLQKVGDAWQPVLDSGGTIAAGIALGTLLLAGVGAAAFALGAVTLGGGAVSIPLAIAAGTAMLVLLGAATLLFIEEIAIVGDRLANRLAPSLAKLNEVLPSLVENMRDFTKFMIEFAGHVLAYSASSVVSGIGATIKTIIGWFTKDPIKSMADDVSKNEKQFRQLNSNLIVVNPLVAKGNELMLIYFGLLDTLKKNADKVASIGTPATIGTNFKDFAKALKEGFDDLAKVKTNNVSKIMSALSSLDLGKFRGIGTSIVQAMELGINNYSYNFNSAINKIKNGLSFNANSVGNSIAGSVITGINARLVNVNTFNNRIKSALNFSAYSIGSDIARGVQNGINGFYPNLTTWTNRLKNNMKVSFEVRSPSRWARDEIGAMIGAGVMIGVNDTDVSFDPFKRSVANEMSNIMPTIDTRTFSADISSLSSSLSNKVSGSFEYTNDGTERAVDKLANVMNDKIDRLIAVTEDGKVLEVNGEVLGKTSEKYRKGNAVRLNTVFR